MRLPSPIERSARRPDLRRPATTISRSRLLGHGDLEPAARRLLGWQAHEHAGLRVAASAPLAEPGAVVLMRLGIGPVAVRVPCRVV